MLYCQQISTNSNLTVEELIENNLVQGCVQVSNINSPINGNANGISSFGYFERGNSNFPFNNGIVISSGDINSAGNTINTSPLNEGDETWLTDPDLEAALNISNTLNATTIEFSFISASDAIQFNYILASEEYYADYPCNYSDGFAFLIRESGSGNSFQNIAIIPNTSTPVNTSTIHEEIVGFCPAENETFFEGYNIGDTNFNGRTTVLTASTGIIPNTQYDIKLIIADQTDRNFDSAVFIEGNSFTNSVNLGDDFSTCDTSTTLTANTNNAQASFAWFLNGNTISGETSNTLTVNASGNYRVEITVPLNDTFCTYDDSINVELSSIQTINPISDFVLCDDSSNDGFEAFDLTTRDTDVFTTLGSNNYTITYHPTYENAANGTTTISNIYNTSNPQTVYINATNNTTGCTTISQVDLVLNPFPIINNPDTIELCSNDNSFSLTNLNNEITNNNTNFNVSFHYSQTDANSGTNPINSSYIPTNSTEELHIRVIDVTTGCVAFSSVTINSYDPPNINTDTQQISSCDLDDNGFDIFDLESVIDEVLNGATDVTETYHTSIEDAENDVNPINNPSSYQNNEPNFEAVFIRIENNSNSCYEITAIELHTNILITGTNIQNFNNCDVAPDDGIAQFNLYSISNSIINGLENVTINLYETLEDLNNNTNALNVNSLYTVNTSQTLHIQLESPDCSYNATIILTVDPSVAITNNTPVTYCDTNDDGFTAIRLSTFNDALSQGVPNPLIDYYASPENAHLGIDSLPEYYNNTTNPVTVYVRATNSETGCYDVKPLEIEVLPAPTTNTPSNFLICDDDQDGFYTIDLTSKNSEITTNTNVTISYFLSQLAANTNTDEITNSTTYTTQSNTIYAKVENNTTGCYALEPITIIINTLPEFTTISNFILCQTNGIQTADFILANKDQEILNNQTGKEVLYFESQNDAINRINIIDKNTVYNNTSTQQTIYARVENTTDNSCFDVTSFIIEVQQEPIYTIAQDVFVCDDISNNGIETFNLLDISNEISNNSPQTLNVTFYLTPEDAQNQTNALANTFTNTVNPQEIFYNVDNGSYCKGIGSFTFNITSVPEINQASSLEVCDTNLDGFSTFDLTTSEVEVLSIRQDNLIITYYENVTDLNSNNNPILNPENYTNTSNPQTVFIEITSPITNCEVAVPIELIVNSPPIINDISPYNICENSTNTFNLNHTITDLIGEQNAAISFFSSQEDLDLNQNALNNIYTYATNNDTIYTRAEFLNSGCYSTSSFTLQVNTLPIANPVADLDNCDDDFDGYLDFNFSQQNATILGNQDPNLYTVSYFASLQSAIFNTNAISATNYNAQDGEEIFIRVENNQTQCFATTSFFTFVMRKPFIEIPDQTICLENIPYSISANTNVNTDTYLWSTGETTPAINISEMGSYTVTVTSNYGCETTATFNIEESQSATIDFTETIDFGEPNNLTVNVSGIGTYLYQFDDEEPQESNFFENVPIGLHYITVIDVNGCASTTKDIVIVDAPKYFTPNGDGIHDTWHIAGIEKLKGTIVTIYNRYGKKLKTLDTMSEGWNGYYNGQPMPGTDYWFTAEVKNGNEEFQVRGHFALKR